MTSPAQTTSPKAALAFTLACTITAVCVDLSPYHEKLHADAVIPVMVSLYQWKPFYWEQDRLGMLVPLLATPFTHPLTNLLVQNGITIFGGLATLGLVTWYLFRDRTWAGTGATGVALFLAAFPEADRYEIFNGAHPYLIPFALAISGLLLVSGRDRLSALRLATGVFLTLLAYWYNAGLSVMVAPFVTGRFLVGRWLDSAPPRRWWSVGRQISQAWAHPHLRELTIGIVLTALGTGFGIALASLAPQSETHFHLAPAEEWATAWVTMGGRTLARFGTYLTALAIAPALGVVWLIVPTTRAVSVRYWLGLGAVGAGFVGLFLLVGMTSWVKLSGYHPRYLLGGLAVLAPAAAGPLVGPLLATFPATIRLTRWIAIAALPGVAIALYGPPSIAAVRDTLDRTAGRWTQDILASECTHAAGDYWAVWPAVFHTNMTLADQGEGRVVWGVTLRSVPTQHLWSQVPAERARIGLLAPIVTDRPADTLWQQVYPDAVPVETRPMLTVYAPGSRLPEVP